MTRIKICGITRAEDALFAADRGADFLGFIFVPGTPRYIDPDRAIEIIEDVRAVHDKPPRFVGVFRDSSVDYINEIVAAVGLDLVQLHGEESDAVAAGAGVPAIKALRISEAMPDTSAYGSASWLLFDTWDAHHAGGTGRRFDWSLLARYERQKPFFLSGGLTPDNVAAAISLVRPDAIDVASGVEASPGVKDHAALGRLFERVRRA
jgi:phosphoribosylanthranilate isomerase